MPISQEAVIIGKRNGDVDKTFITPISLGDMELDRTKGVDGAFNYLEKKANVGSSFSGIVLAAISFAIGIATGIILMWATNGFS